MADKTRLGPWTINIPPGATIIQRIRCNMLAVILAATLGIVTGVVGMTTLVANDVTILCAQRDRLLEAVADMETLAGRMDRLEAALHGGSPIVGEVRP